MNFEEVATLDELRETKRKKIEVNGEHIVLFYLHGQVFAVNSVCPHSGGPLEQGQLDDEEIICPWHSYMFNIKTGLCLNYPGCRIRKYEVKLDGEKVLLKV
jgi:nitrite reductase (NADH) small subunit